MFSPSLYSPPLQRSWLVRMRNSAAFSSPLRYCLVMRLEPDEKVFLPGQHFFGLFFFSSWLFWRFVCGVGCAGLAPPHWVSLPARTGRLQAKCRAPLPVWRSLGSLVSILFRGCHRGSRSCLPADPIAVLGRSSESAFLLLMLFKNNLWGILGA